MQQFFKLSLFTMRMKINKKSLINNKKTIFVVNKQHCEFKKGITSS